MLAARLAVLVALVLPGACENEPRYSASSESAAVDRGRLCADGGATLDQASNECMCGSGATWTGIRCEAPAVAAPEAVPPATGPVLPVAAPPHGLSAVADPALVDAPPSLNSPVPTPVAAERATTPAGDEDNVASRLEDVCRRAKATWLEQDGYCHCPGDQVLVARRCRTLSGNVTDDACRRAVSKGRWRQGTCVCEVGKVFSPARGGCVPKFSGNAAVLRRICESSLNQGKWEARSGGCRCPRGRIWVDELCQVSQELSSRVVCESDANRGRWSAAAKRCACPSGFLWLDQGCRRIADTPAKVACESEASRGVWDAARARCVCPGLTGWRAADKICGR